MDRRRAPRAPLAIFVVLVVVFGASVGTGVVAQSRRPKNLQVSLRANWPGTPLLLEAGELLSKEWKDLFWDFADLWLHADRGSECSSLKCCAHRIVSDGRSLLSEPLASIFEFSLALRSASPRLVLYQQLAEASLAPLPPEGTYELTGDRENSIPSRIQGDDFHANKDGSRTSCCWVDTGSNLLFSVSELVSWLDVSSKLDVDSSNKLEIFDFDHVYLYSSVSFPVSILYGALGTECFKEFHVVLAEAAKKGKVKYVVRPVLPSGCQDIASYCGAVGALGDMNLGGYGVELALKNMEYKAMDDSTVKKGGALDESRSEDLSQEVRGFIFSKILELKPDLNADIMTFRDYLLSLSVSDTLEIWELKDLGHQTVQRVVQSSDPLQTLQEINQNFPSVVSSLSRMKLDESIKDEIIANQRMVPPGKSLMALNGALINIEDVDIYQLLDLVHEDLSLADQFAKFKMPQNVIFKLLSVPPPSESHGFRLDFRSQHVHYINNLEEDPMYKRWRSNINEILMPVFPGQMRYIRKNLFHSVYVFDPATICGVESIDTILTMYQNSVPMRFGVLMYSSKLLKVIEEHGGKLPSSSSDSSRNQFEDDISILITCLFLYIKEKYDGQLAFQFLKNLHKLWSSLEDYNEDSPEHHHVEEAFVEVLLSKAKSPPQDVLLQVRKESSYKRDAEESSLFVFKLGISELHCCFLMNGRLVHESTEDASMNAMNEELPRIQEQVYYGHITSSTDVLEKFLSENSYRRYNTQILSEDKGKKNFISLFMAYLQKQSLLQEINYLHSPGTVDEVKPITHLVAVNVTSREGIKLLHEGLQYLMEGSNRVRVGILFHVDEQASPAALVFMKAFEKTFSLFGWKEKVLDFLGEVCSLYESQYAISTMLDSEGVQLFIDQVSELAGAYGLSSMDYKTVLSDISVDAVKQHMDKIQFIYGQLGLVYGINAVITNGRVIVPRNGKPFLQHDFSLLESVEYEQRTKHIMKIIEEVQWENVDPDELTSKFYSDLAMLVSSAMSTRERSSERARFEILHAQHSAIVLNSENSSIHIDVVIDPLSAPGQKLSPLLHILWKYVHPSMRIVLNPVSSLVDLPLKNYYRYVVPTMDDFSAIDSSVNGPKAFFPNMPLSKTLTMNLDVPEPWLVEPIIAIHDLDNILLENIGDDRTLQAIFKLEALLLTGHCSEKYHDPPRGLQLILGTKRQPHLVDTLVMANLGYWQMKISPGVWYLQLAPGRSSELYMLQKNGDENRADIYSKRVVINNLMGKLMHLDVEKKRGKEHEELLSASDDDFMQEKKKDNHNWNTNLLKWASGFIGGNGISKKNGSNLEHSKGRHGKVINIFSIASGHLYERFLKIMILSVLKSTQRPLKFWFIKNYLSPLFKDVIPHMATEYGFDFELITYKWPTWLHKQKEKQRIIWAYKILFLDVIFPLSLEKVIFVDADQVVRTDMGELYDMDIKGRPLAYTPFCDNNKDMDGYRFWRQGFWKDHLRGRPYHISALYVVDLVKFRQTAAGDTLRVYYETLSKDPNSLSNLDQDLPNYAQHTVPIFSLPQEWLWCESWCGNATKSKAKTIDLCNNPMTKEPKLQGAKRIVSEWTSLDAEARAVTARILGEEIDDTQEPTAPPPAQPGSTTGNADEGEDVGSKDEL